MSGRAALHPEERVARDADAAAVSACPLPPDRLDRLGEAYWFTCCGGGEGVAWADLPEFGRLRFRALAARMMARAGEAAAP